MITDNLCFVIIDLVDIVIKQIIQTLILFTQVFIYLYLCLLGVLSGQFKESFEN